MALVSLNNVAVRVSAHRQVAKIFNGGELHWLFGVGELCERPLLMVLRAFPCGETGVGARRIKIAVKTASFIVAKKIQEHSMADNKNPNPKQRGDHYNPGNMSGKTIGTHTDKSEDNNRSPNQKQRGDHFNPGNMSGKTVGAHEDESERSKADRLDSRQEQQDKNKKPSI
jgi:hypothetical protein